MTGEDRPTSARELARRQAAEQRGRYVGALAKQRNDRLVAGGRIVPARITLALDYGGHEGPEVDIACGAQEPDVDLWECGVAVPDEEQLRLLSALTGFPVPFFYLPIPPGPLLGGAGRMWICGPKGCHSPEPDWVDERGVLHYGGESPRTPPAAFQTSLVPAPAPTPKPRRPRPAPARREQPAPAVQQPMLPVGRLSDDARAELVARIEASKQKFRR